ncbi:hypothetical protein SteCoe_3960 [Stentor coeruleus]|uniref:O-acyltransferase n=1 Tax=Stentor coeruleus TaxID=5963 RepID=A0A1R2CVW1_9CILI|nr:hypothetical protein SteCoe_3960 [Stentor coeruleus]
MDKKHPSSLVYSKHQPSYLDLSDESAGIHKNELKGFYMLFVLVTGFYILINSFNKFYSAGYFVEDSFFWAMIEDGKFVALVWPGAFFYSWFAFLLQLLILKGLSETLASIFQHLTQSLMFIIATYLAVSRNWGFSQSLYVMMLAFTHFMKMHSYTMVNRDLRNEYLENCKDSKYPRNITMKNYFKFLITPAIVYQIEYPQRENFRVKYFVLKFVLMIVECICLYMMFTEYFIPIIRNAKNMSFLDVYTKLMIPCVVSYNLLFLIIFEQILNMFAEMSYFSDREFYQQWWNSDGYEDFGRKWNRPVHFFLYKHIYLECTNHFKLSPQKAKYATYLFSSLCHELIIAVMIRRIAPFLFGLMMFQFPLILINKFINKNEFGIYLFWVGVITGPALLVTCYAKI